MATRLSLLVVALVASLGLAEFVLRSLPSTALGYAVRDRVFVPPAEFERRQVRNSLGTYDREPAGADPERHRVLLLGDSYVESISMARGRSLPDRLVAHLDGFRPGAYDVFSLSKSGWGQREELRALQRFGPRLAPDRVVLLFTSRNDPLNNARDLPGLDENLRLRGEMLNEGRPWSRSFRYDQAAALWFPGSALNQLISHRLTVSRLRPLDPVPLQFLAFSPERQAMWDATWEETAELLRALRSVSEELGATFEVVSASSPEGVLPEDQGAERLRAAHPSFDSLSFDTDLPDRRLSQICAELEIPFFTLQPSLRVREVQVGPLHWRYDGHWNEVGNDEAAALIARRIVGSENER